MDCDNHTSIPINVRIRIPMTNEIAATLRLINAISANRFQNESCLIIDEYAVNIAMIHKPRINVIGNAAYGFDKRK